MSDSTSTVLSGWSAPGETDSPRTALYTDAFAADPHGHYRDMRAQHGSLAPVLLAPDVPATLALGYLQALRILRDPDHFPADPRDWERGVPADCPVRPMMEPRRNAIRSAGSEHERYRSAIAYALDGVDLYGLNTVVADSPGR
ncbi:hypothetical protein [Nocardia sp. NBC_00403]|uniref:hypothetical protein n=1 Tax=Nocardia sp. NBC_00403 TaxID=2975990 RepID=UPI002E1C3CF0